MLDPEFNIHDCAYEAECYNTPGSFNCTCWEGYSGDGWFCDDIDECVGNNTCHEFANCTNIPGLLKIFFNLVM